MTRDNNEIPAIFNPRRVRAPSVVVTGDSPNGPFDSFTNILNSTNQSITHSDSLTSTQPETGGSIVCSTVDNVVCLQQVNTPAITELTPLPQQSHVISQHQQQQQQQQQQLPQTTTLTENSRKTNKCKESCCSELAQKMYFGICVTILITVSWVGASHCIKFLYIRRHNYMPSTLITISTDTINSSNNNTTIHINPPTNNVQEFNAPFFASWFCTNFSILFFPIYLLGRLSVKKCESPSEILGDVIRGFRDKGFTAGRFLNRCMTFCILWLLTTYLYALSLRALLATDAISLFATNVACAYLLSWVILHEQFVGVRIIAVIMCDTGIALLAYMDGITGSPTLGGVVLAVLAAAGYAVFKVMFKKVMGYPPINQVAFTFSMLGFLNATMFWPICLLFYFSGTENMPWEKLPWIILLIASVLLMVFHILTQFSYAVTYNMFVTLGLITSVPVSAALDVILYGANFSGMKLAGVILISIGFFLVMFPNNWPDYITRLLRKTGRAILRYQCCCEFAEIDYEKDSKYHLVGSQREMGTRSSKRHSWTPPSYGHRLSDGLYSLTSTFSIRPCEMTESISQNFNNQQNSPHSITTISINKTMSETNFMRLGSKRKFSYGSTD